MKLTATYTKNSKKDYKSLMITHLNVRTILSRMSEIRLLLRVKLLTMSGLSASEQHNQCTLTNFIFASILYLLLESYTLTVFKK